MSSLTHIIRNPADHRQMLGEVSEPTPKQIDATIAALHEAMPSWAQRPVAERAACLERMANFLERETLPLMKQLILEAGKTRADALAELREAVDFCRYYAAQARDLQSSEIKLPGPTGEYNALTLHARGVFACISPWNFPLAIFLGQIAAAVVTGNTVIAKPAPQTPLIAMRVGQLLNEAGIPQTVVKILPGSAQVGECIVRDKRISGIAFTGSIATARHIARATLEDEQRPLVALIAETGGINAMIVDSSALPEQVVNDVITSAFHSAGQRCSALRLLCVQADIYERVMELLTGAMNELRVGDPLEESTDVGPLIDAAACARVQQYIDAHRSRVLHQAPLSDAATRGWFVAPTVLRLDRPDELQQEVFGPVLHVVSWRAGEMDALLDALDANGYGLTMGLHSRIDSVVQHVRRRAHVGNLYINRSMIGAVVGSQPFGGEKLSGTGPKAGGPHYLLRFCTERTVCIDTTAAVGNPELLNRPFF